MLKMLIDLCKLVGYHKSMITFIFKSPVLHNIGCMYECRNKVILHLKSIFHLKYLNGKQLCNNLDNIQYTSPVHFALESRSPSIALFCHKNVHYALNISKQQGFATRVLAVFCKGIRKRVPSARPGDSWPHTTTSPLTSRTNPEGSRVYYFTPYYSLLLADTLSLLGGFIFTLNWFCAVVN